MVQITRYEVYSDQGDGWKLVEQFSGEERQEASFCAKEIENNGYAVKIIREVYEITDGSFQESVEYVGGLKKKAKPKVVSVEDAVFNDLNGEYNVEATPLKMLAENQVAKAVLKLLLIVVFSLILANILTSLSVPIVEFMVPDEKRKSVLFIGFFTIFIAISGPLLFYKIPWNVFYSIRKDDKDVINEKVIFRRATNLMGNYNLNDDGKEVIVPVFPEAPLEYKEYIIDYLTQILNNMSPEINLKDSFNRLGVKLIVYGGCLELAKYGHLVWAEANTLLYEAIKILDGEQVDLQAFYDAKRTYQDNKTAVFLTGVGSYLMAQIIQDIPMDDNVLRMTLEKWITTKNSQQDEEKTPQVEENIGFKFDCLVNTKLNINIFEDEKDISPDEQKKVNKEIRETIIKLVKDNQGDNAIEEQNIISVRFSSLRRALAYITSFFSVLEEYKEKHSEYNLILDAKVALLNVEENIPLFAYLSDIFEYVYNSEIVVTGVIKDELLESPYGFEYLGDKKLSKSEITIPLYKMTF